MQDFSDSSTSGGAAGRDIVQGVVSDLKASGRFVLIDASIAPQAGAVVPQFDKWRGTNAAWLVTGFVKDAPPGVVEKKDHRLLVQFRLWNGANGQQLLGQQYVFGPENLQRFPHLIAEEIVKVVGP